ncbi:DegT/DnrJ/EryC1/StrS family aminotransferase [Herbaspirillum aquaticum]|uniref:DegT/DnrJ/EryC1/StrS family aminotransferase n=1 Tax=Herbaspirillum aquaticum TaxID=568783 RepID=UPI00240A3C89|nr:DegT/DnrJ/EryC1/StrS family aminotransferase [Herbaspirillum aquaticum]
MVSSKNIYVTQPFLPPLTEFVTYLEKIWANKILTNNGPLHQELEAALRDFLGVDHIALFNNGTIALIAALQALEITGEVITTPYSFVATVNSQIWNHLQPVFADIDPVTMNLSAASVEAAITARTTAILPVHCYGTACDVDGIAEVARRHGLKVIYDAAHAFGVQHGDRSLLQYGDLSVLSFHATKVFNTFEGGAIVCHDAATKQRIDNLKNFGFVDETTVVESGINGKMSEVNAAMGLLQLRYVEGALSRRREIALFYNEALAGIDGITVVEGNRSVHSNNAYYPILVEDHYPLSRDALYEKLKADNIFGRRYFYPLISEMPMYRNLPSAAPGNLPVAHQVARKILCLPIYPALEAADLQRIVSIIAH